MIQAYNFLASWQLFPEKGTYEWGDRPLSGLYKISAPGGRKELQIEQNWVSLEHQAFGTEYVLEATPELQTFTHPEMADEAQLHLVDSIRFEIHFYKKGEACLHVVHEIMPNGYLRIQQQGKRADGSDYINTEYYHKQLSVLPYSASVAGAVIRPNEEGLIRHKALTAMEEQTNMQLDQIRKQIELLALQAQEIQQRKELSMMIYNTRLSFKPNIGQVYYLYEKKDGSHMLSLVSPKEWGTGGPFSKFVAAVKLLADHTWVEIS